MHNDNDNVQKIEIITVFVSFFFFFNSKNKLCASHIYRRFELLYLLTLETIAKKKNGRNAAGSHPPIYTNQSKLYLANWNPIQQVETRYIYFPLSR